MIVDTGLPHERDLVLEKLRAQGLTPKDIENVVCTCGQTDHTGNNNLFPDATFFISYDISRKDDFTFFLSSEEGQSYVIDTGVEIIPTPGHSSRDLSVLVQTERGVVALTGDLFKRQGDLRNASLWRSFSEFPDLQQKSRRRILATADFIVPGHGPMFAVTRRRSRSSRRFGFQPPPSST